MEAAGALATLAPSPITVLGLIPLLALGITYFRYQQYDPESYITEVNAVSILSKIIYIFFFCKKPNFKENKHIRGYV